MQALAARTADFQLRTVPLRVRNFPGYQTSAIFHSSCTHFALFSHEKPFSTTAGLIAKREALGSPRRGAPPSCWQHAGAGGHQSAMVAILSENASRQSRAANSPGEVYLRLDGRPAILRQHGKSASGPSLEEGSRGSPATLSGQFGVARTSRLSPGNHLPRDQWEQPRRRCCALPVRQTAGLGIRHLL